MVERTSFRLHLTRCSRIRRSSPSTEWGRVAGTPALTIGPLVRILLTNDDGVYAPGLEALRNELVKVGDVTVVAPTTEQSGVGHSITLLSPMVVQRVYDAEEKPLGWAVEGSPADCVKLALLELLPEPPDLVVSGINSGPNAGINVLYSGTVAAAIEGAFFSLTSVAVSLDFVDHPEYQRAAALARGVVEQVIERRPPAGCLFNLNLPALDRADPKGLRVVPMGIDRFGERFERRVDPRGRTYYWLTEAPRPRSLDGQTDVSSLADGYATLTPLHFDLTRSELLGEVAGWNWEFTNNR